MERKPWIAWGVILALGMLAAWYGFIDEPDDPFLLPEQQQMLADPKVPPDAEPPAAPPDVTNAAGRSPEQEPETDQAKCPRGDPMCGGL